MVFFMSAFTHILTSHIPESYAILMGTQG